MTSRWRGLVPNALSAARALLALALPFLAGEPSLAVVVMVACAGTDVLDGYLARRWAVADARGALIDSLADVVFYVAVAVTVLLAVPSSQRAVIVAGVLIVLVARSACVVVSFVRRGRATFVHTLLNKAAGGVVLVGAGVTILGGQLWPILAAGIFALVAALEELVIQLTATSIEPDRTSYFAGSRRSE